MGERFGSYRHPFLEGYLYCRACLFAFHPGTSGDTCCPPCLYPPPKPIDWKARALQAEASLRAHAPVAGLPRSVGVGR